MDEAGIAVDVKSSGDGVVAIAVAGELDAASVSDLRTTVDAVSFEGVRTIVLDLGQLPFMDSTGLGALVGAKRNAERRGARFHLANPSRPIEKLLEVTRAASYFDIEPTTER